MSGRTALLACDGDTDHKFRHIGHNKIQHCLHKNYDASSVQAHNQFLGPVPAQIMNELHHMS